MLPSNVEEEQASRITREEVQEALLRWEGQAFERRAREEGIVHGNLLGPTSHLGALRVLDLSRVLAGPIAARTLALHGSQVLQISSQNLPNLPLAELDTARGKRCARLDLNEAQDRETFKQLIQGTDVVLQAYRPGSIASKGFSPSEAQQLRPGIVYASLSAYGFTGPWSNVRGFDSLTQTACGINHEEALSYARYRKSKQCEAEGDVNANVDSGAIEPRALPCQALDHAAAYMLAFGILASLIRHELSGSSKGSHVQVSLAGVAYWLASLGRVHGVEAWEVDPLPNVEAYLQASKIRSDSRADQEGEQVRATLFGVAHAANIQGVSTRYGEAPVRIGIDAAEWAA
ncbi:Predicted L-carnitine dehydratase/alpha-methylacyl-CoA racemase [Ceraceosorus bombacis]|uniref:Predicted L-carnitine dehydratase/alpha-methylacyl-CoA racemase n=1 Tax=Ceraceosorus bombacis TaxID=401625 RepID=A0A0P1B9D8_9BASI|nr:Predicted L-carnitine dehydratase/alpha-methylacyl-CoA racemase [Ceraceosorus bombacis]